MRSRRELGAAIAGMRQASGMTQEVLAGKAGLSRPTVANIESGRQGVTVETLGMIAGGLGTPIAVLLGEQPAERLTLEILARLTRQQREITKSLTEVAVVVVSLAEVSERLEKAIVALADQG